MTDEEKNAKNKTTPVETVNDKVENTSDKGKKSKARSVAKSDKSMSKESNKKPSDKTSGKKSSEKKNDEERHKGEPEKTRVWEVQSQLSDDGRPALLTEGIVQKYLKKYDKSIKRWAWVCHDKDYYSEADVEENAARHDGKPTISVKKKKPAHIHLALEFYNPVYASAIAADISKIGKIEFPIQQVQKAKAKRNQFLAIASYFTHEDEKQQLLGKHRYEDSEIHCSLGFDYRTEVDKYFHHRHIVSAANMKRASVYELIGKVEKGEITFPEIKARYGYGFFLDYEQKFAKARVEYLKKYYKMRSRINYYIEGVPGTGKSSLAELFAMCLNLGLGENDAYFTAGGKNVRFDGYEQQPVIIWQDVRSKELLDKFGHEEILNLLETHPKKRFYNVKFSTVLLTNEVNIFTGNETYHEFLDGLSDGENKNQIYRRFPIVISVHPNDIDVLINKGVFEKSLNYDEYIRYARIGLSVRSMNTYFEDKYRLMMVYEALYPVFKKHEQYMNMDFESKLYKSMDDVPIIQIFTGDELTKIDEEEKSNYAAYEQTYQRAKEIAEENGAVEPEQLSFEAWKMAGCPESVGEDAIYTNMFQNGPVSLEDSEKIDRWLKACRGYEPFAKKKVEDYTDEDFAREAWYGKTIIALNYKYEALKKSPTIESLDACCKELGTDYDFFAKEPVVKRIAKYAAKKGLIKTESEFSQYVNDRTSSINIITLDDMIDKSTST